MNYRIACENLDILVNDTITMNLLKKQYRLKALVYHPDKNKSADASHKFQEIHESYEYLLKYLEFIDFDEDDEFFDEEESDSKSGYKWVLYSFLKNVINDAQQTGILYKIIQKISNLCEDKALQTLEKIDKPLLLKIGEIIKKYRQVFHFSIDFFDKVDELLSKKVSNDECILLQPSIDDIFENNLYRLKVRDFTYIIPLWHHELIYDNSGNDVVVQINPLFPENVDIDEKNDIHIHLCYRANEIIDKECVEFAIGKRTFTFFPRKMKFVRKQVFVLYKQGISKINTKNIYDISYKSDVVIHMEILIGR